MFSALCTAFEGLPSFLLPIIIITNNAAQQCIAVWIEGSEWRAAIHSQSSRTNVASEAAATDHLIVQSLSYSTKISSARWQ